MRKIDVAVLATIMAASGCGELRPIIPGNGGNENASDAMHCRDMSVSARRRADSFSFGGWMVSVAGVGVTATGATIIPLDGELSRWQKITAASLIVSGAILLPVGQALFSRSDASSALAAETAEALGELDKDGNPVSGHELRARCNAALAAWEKSRTSATEFATSLLEREKGQAKVKEEERLTVEAEVERKALEACDTAAGCSPQAIIKIQAEEETKRQALEACQATGECKPADIINIQRGLVPAPATQPAPPPRPGATP